jgi:hypothetical protein
MHKLFLIFLLIFPRLTQAQASNWVFKAEKEGVKVYYKATKDVHEIKLITSIKSSLAGLIQLFSEVDRYPTWGYKIIESRLLKRVSPTELYYYSRIDFPWPLYDRDIIMHTKTVQDPATKKIVATSHSVPDYLPEVPNVVRMHRANTSWTMYPNATGWLYCEYYIYTDPGGNIPNWVINMAIDIGPRETIKKIKEQLLQPRYQSVKLKHIKE